MRLLAAATTLAAKDSVVMPLPWCVLDVKER